MTLYLQKWGSGLDLALRLQFASSWEPPLLRGQEDGKELAGRLREQPRAVGNQSSVVPVKVGQGTGESQHQVRWAEKGPVDLTTWGPRRP